MSTLEAPTRRKPLVAPKYLDSDERRRRHQEVIRVLDEWAANDADDGDDEEIMEIIKALNERRLEFEVPAVE